jgi:hypothetical protein
MRGLCERDLVMTLSNSRFQSKLGQKVIKACEVHKSTLTAKGVESADILLRTSTGWANGGPERTEATVLPVPRSIPSTRTILASSRFSQRRRTDTGFVFPAIYMSTHKMA